jgi:hypothetical protein
MLGVPTADVAGDVERSEQVVGELGGYPPIPTDLTPVDLWAPNVEDEARGRQRATSGRATCAEPENERFDVASRG